MEKAKIEIVTSNLTLATSKMSRCKKYVLFILFIIIFQYQNSALAQNPRLSNIDVPITRDHLLIYLTVTGAFPEKIEKAILSGVPTTFSYIITLHKVRNMWFDQQIVDLKLTHTIRYNIIKKEFIITRSSKKGDPIVTQSLTEARKRMCEIDNLKIVELNKLEKGSRYQIRAKAELSKLTLPFYLHYILFFVSLWDFETDWHTVDFIY